MPNTREKLIELLSKVSCNGNGETLGSCPDRKYGLCGEAANLSYCVIQNTVNHLIANGVIIKSDCEDCASKTTRIIDKLHGEIAKLTAVHKWIPVTERLPESDVVVLVCGSRGGVYTAYMHCPGYWHKLNSKSHYCNPTHWMPLPEPPKGE